MKKLFIANWKMSMTAGNVRHFLRTFKNPKPDKAGFSLAASYPHLQMVLASKFSPTAQDVSSFEPGAFTGEVSAVQLREIGVKVCLVGHSERRVYFGEDDKLIRQKMLQLLNNHIHPVLCFGENAEEKEAGKTMSVIRRQLSILKGLPNFESVVLAYEPVWAISTFQKGKNKQKASDEDIRKIHKAIKLHLKKLLGTAGGRMPLLYGGSVNPENSRVFLNFPEVDGALVGAASLDASSFKKIINNIA